MAEDLLQGTKIMGNQNHQPVDIDPEILRESRSLWSNFTKATTYGVVAVAIILVLMAVFLA
jgi:hypothetical protein